MQFRRLLRSLAAPALLFVSACHHAPPWAIDPSVASCIPPATRAVAGIDVAALRRSALYSRLPQSVRTLVEGIPGAQRVFVAWNGADLLTLAEGDFPSSPAGFTRVTNRIAVTGSPAAVHAAQAQHESGRTGIPGLLARAEPAAGSTIWVAAAGEAAMPLAGNIANLARLLRYTNYTTAAASVSDRISVDVQGFCAGPAKARELEEKLRALISLFSAATSHRSEVAAIWTAIRVETSGSTVHARASLSTEASEKALSLLL